MTDFGKRSGLTYVDRGDPAVWDKQTSSFTTDAQWHELDLSSIIPDGTILVHLNLAVQDELVGSYLQLREAGNISNNNVITVRTYVSDIYVDRTGFVVPNSDRIIEYTASNTAFRNILLAVRGWFI